MCLSFTCTSASTVKSRRVYFCLVSIIDKLVTMDKEKAELLNISASVFTGDCSSRSPEVGGLKGGNWGSDASLQLLGTYHGCRHQTLRQCLEVWLNIV